LVAELFPSARGRAIGIHGSASQLAAVLAPGIVVTVLLVAGWGAVFHLLAVVALVVTAALIGIIRRNPLPPGAGADRNFRSALGHWRVILVGVVIVGAPGFVWQGVFNFYVTYLIGTKGLSSGLANTTSYCRSSSAGAPGVRGSGGRARRPPSTTYPYLLAIMGCFTVALTGLVLAESVAALVAVTVLLGLVIHALFPAIDTFILESLPADNRASAYAVFSGVAMGLEATGSGVTGFAAEAVGFDAAFAAGAVGVLLVAGIVGTVHLFGRLPGGRRDSSDASGKY